MNLPATIRDAHPLYVYGMDLATQAALLRTESTCAFATFQLCKGAELDRNARAMESRAVAQLRLWMEVRR